jgi:hypothetical protein
VRYIDARGDQFFSQAAAIRIVTHAADHRHVCA